MGDLSKKQAGFPISNKLVGLILFLGILLFKLPVINMPYHWDVLAGVAPGALWICHHGLNPLLGPFDYGHPPLFHEILAIVWSIFGYSIWISHLVGILFSFIGVYFTYLLGAELKDKKSGIIAALLLFLSPLYFAQSGILNLEIPLTAFIIMAVYFVIKKNTKMYLLAGICSVMTKGPGLLLVLSVLLYTLFKNRRKPKGEFFKEFLIYSIPFLFFLAWIIFHKWQTGWFLYPRNFNFHFSGLMPALYQISKGLFYEKYHCFITAMMFSCILVMRYKVLKKSLFLLLLFILSVLVTRTLFLNSVTFYLFLLFFVLFSIQIIFKEERFFILIVFTSLCLVFFSAHDIHLPRYLLVLYPFYYIAGVYCMFEIAGGRKLVLYGTVIILITISLTGWYGHRDIKSDGSGALLESNLEYLDLISTHKSAAGFIEENYPRSIVITGWPQQAELEDPLMGYVNIPVKGVYFSDSRGKLGPGIDLVYYSDQSHNAFKMREFMRGLNLKIVAFYERNNKFVAVYKIIRD